MTEAELTFCKRMLPHFLAGKTAAEAASAVLEDDVRLFSSMLTDASPIIVGDFSDGRTIYSRQHERGVGLQSALAAEVYDRLRA